MTKEAMTLTYPIVICSYALYEHCKERYPKRESFPDRNVRANEFFYWNRKGQMRTVENKNEIWISEYEWCDLLKMNVPNGSIVRRR